MAIGATSPHMPQRLIPEAIAQDQSLPTEIRTHYLLNDEEIAQIDGSIPQIATNMALSRLGQQFPNQAAVIGFLSSDDGKQAVKTVEQEIRVGLGKMRISHECRLDLTIDYATGRMAGSDPLGQAVFAFLEQRCPPSVTVFSYFPADRALPTGEPAIHFGGADVGNQLESHNSQPQLKYSRLKNVIFNAVISSPDGRDMINNEFSDIFSYVLKGRSLAEVGINQIGLLSIKIQDTETGRKFDLDGMSSGEKGLILTSLMITRSIVNGGVVLLDEPELHLNPAVCKDVLRFLSECHVKPRAIQMFLCSHSVEILNAIFDRDKCALYHLASESSLSRIHKQDREEINEALRRLGTSEGEGLLYKATIFVEGEHDVEILEAGFSNLLRRYKLRELGGRGEVERHIGRLQDAETRAQNIPLSFFIFDHDRKPASLLSSTQVKVLQWPRYCLENFRQCFTLRPHTRGV